MWISSTLFRLGYSAHSLLVTKWRESVSRCLENWCPSEKRIAVQVKRELVSKLSGIRIRELGRVFKAEENTQVAMDEAKTQD